MEETGPRPEVKLQSIYYWYHIWHSNFLKLRSTIFFAFHYNIVVDFSSKHLDMEWKESKTNVHWTLDVHFRLNNDGKLDGQIDGWVVMAEVTLRFI